MPSAPTVSNKTHEYVKYYVCKRHLKKRRTTTSSYIRTYGMCPCYVRCDGHHESAWYICVDKRGTGRCDGESCNHFYLNNEQGYIDEDGYCYYLDNEPACSSDGAQIRLPAIPSPLSSKSSSSKSHGKLHSRPKLLLDTLHDSDSSESYQEPGSASSLDSW